MSGLLTTLRRGLVMDELPEWASEPVSRELGEPIIDEAPEQRAEKLALPKQRAESPKRGIRLP